MGTSSTCRLPTVKVGSTASRAQAEHCNVAGDCEKSRSALCDAEALLREASGIRFQAQTRGYAMLWRNPGRVLSERGSCDSRRTTWSAISRLCPDLPRAFWGSRCTLPELVFPAMRGPLLASAQAFHSSVPLSPRALCPERCEHAACRARLQEAHSHFGLSSQGQSNSCTELLGRLL